MIRAWKMHGTLNAIGLQENNRLFVYENIHTREYSNELVLITNSDHLGISQRALICNSHIQWQVDKRDGREEGRRVLYSA